MRPVYESQDDLRNEREAIELVASRFGMEAVKLPQFKVDFALRRPERDNVWGVAEVKVRQKHYPQMYLSLDKVQMLRNYAASGIQARIIFGTPKGVYVKKIGPLEIDGWIGIGGRTDRGDDRDQEMMVYFGDLVQNDKVYREEAEPMTRICDPLPQWFKGRT